jgi:DnaJ-class molecular chaperone
MSFFPDDKGLPPYNSLVGQLQRCLTCGGTGRRGRLSGKKLCKECKGKGTRYCELTKDGKPTTPGSTVCDSNGE